jgi:hypothetical protein
MSKEYWSPSWQYIKGKWRHSERRPNILETLLAHFCQRVSRCFCWLCEVKKSSRNKKIPFQKETRRYSQPLASCYSAYIRQFLSIFSKRRVFVLQLLETVHLHQIFDCCFFHKIHPGPMIPSLNYFYFIKNSK